MSVWRVVPLVNLGAGGPLMASKKQAAARSRFARQARAKGKTKVGKAAASRTRRKKKPNGCPVPTRSPRNTQVMKR